jgi:hypothetical protein
LGRRRQDHDSDTPGFFAPSRHLRIIALPPSVCPSPAAGRQPMVAGQVRTIMRRHHGNTVLEASGMSSFAFMNTESQPRPGSPRNHAARPAPDHLQNAERTHQEVVTRIITVIRRTRQYNPADRHYRTPKSNRQTAPTTRITWLYSPWRNDMNFTSMFRKPARVDAEENIVGSPTMVWKCGTHLQ